MCLFGFSTQNHAEPFRNFLEKTVFDPKCALFDQNSDFGHVWTYSSLHKLRNTQGKVHGTYLGNIYGIYKECITTTLLNKKLDFVLDRWRTHRTEHIPMSMKFEGRLADYILYKD